MAKRTYPKTLVLPELETRVNKSEQALGPSSAMGRTPEKSGFMFDGGPPPDGELKLVQKVAGAAAQPPGSTKIYEGLIWNAGVAIDATAFRLSADP